MDRDKAELRWGIEQRLEFIEFRLFWEGSINRSDIKDFFGVSVPQASKDLTLYQERAPGNIEYDTRAKRYVAKYTINPAIAHGVSGHLGSVERAETLNPLLASWLTSS